MEINYSLIGFIGGGNMAFAICQGIINNGCVKADHIWVSGPRLESLQKFKALGINITNDNGNIIRQCNVVFLSIKPQYLSDAIADIFKSKNLDTKSLSCNLLFISILAGTSLSKLDEVLSRFLNRRIIRVMPNTPMLLGEGVSVYCPGSNTTNEDCNFIEKILGCCGIFERVPEHLINAVGALAGSGPAFVYLMIEALADGGVKQGIPRSMATRLAAQTALGAAKMVLDTGKHPGQLKDDVCSAGGSTICGIHALEKGGVRGSYIDAVEAAIQRSKAMEKEN